MSKSAYSDCIAYCVVWIVTSAISHENHNMIGHSISAAIFCLLAFFQYGPKDSQS